MDINEYQVLAKSCVDTLKGKDNVRRNALRQAGNMLNVLCSFCSSAGITFDDVIAHNIEKLKERYPNMFENNEGQLEGVMLSSLFGGDDEAPVNEIKPELTTENCIAALEDYFAEHVSMKQLYRKHKRVSLIESISDGKYIADIRFPENSKAAMNIIARRGAELETYLSDRFGKTVVVKLYAE